MVSEGTLDRARGSDLSRWQADFIRRLLRTLVPEIRIELQTIVTPGDKNRTAPLHQLGETGSFTSTIEQALLDKRADLAVHSLKDLPTQIAEGLTIAAIPARDDPSDVLISRPKRTLETLPIGARVLTSSLRRRAMVLHRRGDLRVHNVRGNLPTRIARLHAGVADAIVLALAGLTRLKMEGLVCEKFDPTAFLPAPGQGALAVEIRSDDKELLLLIARLDDPLARACVTAERSMLAALHAGCHAPVGAYARFQEDGRVLTLTGGVLSVDGTRVVYRWESVECGGDEKAAQGLGIRVADALFSGGAGEILWAAAEWAKRKNPGA